MWKSVELRVTAGFFLLPAAAICLGAGEVLPWVLLSALCHELGHVLVLWLWGAPPERITLSVMGAEIVARRQERLSYGRELCAVLAGAAVNILLAVVAARVWHAYLFAGTNAVLAAYNLLPIRGLDGSRALYLAVAWMSDPFLAERFTAGVDVAASGLLLGLSLALVIVGGGWPLLLALLGLWLGRMVRSKRKEKRGKRGCQTGRKKIQ